MLELETVTIDAPPDAVWSLIARPDRWHEWSPYVAGAEDLGDPEVEEGAVGSVLLRGGLRIGAEILEVVPGQLWAWRVKGLMTRHQVEPVPGGTRLSMTSRRRSPVGAARSRLPPSHHADRAERRPRRSPELARR